MPTYYRIHLGRNSAFANECLAGNVIGIDFEIPIDFAGEFGNSWQEFNRTFIPQYQARHTESSRRSAGIAAGAMYVIGQQMQDGDMVIAPVGNSNYRVGRINGAYHYVPDTNLPHRRGIEWYTRIITKDELSPSLIRSIHSQMTVINLSASENDYGRELNTLLGIPDQADSETIDSYAFALEKHLEEFISKNWQTLELAKQYDIYQDEDQTGQQYPIGNGYIDILAISKDKRRLLVIELKKGRTSDVVVGQILRYMGYVKESIAEAHQQVHGIIIAHEDDPSMQMALSMTSNIDFYQYHIQFSLQKG
jgi:restriction system protein